MRRRVLVDLSALALLLTSAELALSGCSTCVTGRQVACTCPGGARGTQTCLSDGTYGSCFCEVATVCAPNQSSACTCTNGAQGTQICAPDGTQFSPCDCGMTTACMPGEVIPCACANGGQGTQACNGSGSGFGLCGNCIYHFCTPGQTVSCACDINQMYLGSTTCLSDGSGFAACTNCMMTGCTPGSTIGCTCDNGASGMASCLMDGSGYGLCTGCNAMVSWYCNATSTSCYCADDSYNGNSVTCGSSFACCFSGTVNNGVNGSYRDCDSDDAWAMNCDGYINSLMTTGGYTDVHRVNTCPQ